MTRQLALLILSATLASCMETKETVQRMVMVRTTGSDVKPETKGFIYKRESDGPTKVTKMEQDEVMEEFSKMYKFPEAFYAPIPYAAGPFYNKEDDSPKADSIVKEIIVPVFENIEESSEIKSDSKPVTANSDQSLEQPKPYAPNFFDDYTSDFQEYLASLGYHDDFYKGGSWADYGHVDHPDINAARSIPNQYRYHVNNNNPESYSTEKYAIYTLLSSDKNKKNDEDKDYDTTTAYVHDEKTEKDKKDKYNDDFQKDEYASDFDFKTTEADKNPTFNKKVDEYHRDFDDYEHKKDNDDSHVEASRDYFSRFPVGYDYVQSDADDEEIPDTLDNTEVPEELKDCCYEEKPK